MEIKEMDFEQLEARRAELAEEIGAADAERLDAINAELDAIEARKKEIKAEAEERAKAIEEIISAPGPNPIIEERTNKKMTSKEIRNSAEYVNAYAEYVKGGYKDETECRKILTQLADPENVGEDDTTIPAPAYLAEKIATAWENNDVLARVTRTYIKGVVRVGVELSGSDAVIHEEGGDPIDEEELAIDIVELVPAFIKKFISVSDEALALTGTAFLDYLYDEITYRLFKKLADAIVAAIGSSSIVTTLSDPVAPLEAVIAAFANVSDEATDVCVITNKTTWAKLKAAAIAGNFAIDPFNGFDVVFNSTVPDDTIIVGDLKGATVNFPDGGEPKFVFDNTTLMTSDLVRILGKIYAAVGITAPGRFAIAEIAFEASDDENPGD